MKDESNERSRFFLVIPHPSSIILHPSSFATPRLANSAVVQYDKQTPFDNKTFSGDVQL